MYKPPDTYSEWMSLLDVLREKKNDEEVLRAMQLGKLEWQSGVAERFSQSLINVVNDRMNVATDRFQKELGRSMGQERNLVQSLLAVRKELKFLTFVVDIPALPDDERRQYQSLIREQADNMQQSLEDSAKKDRTGKLSSIIRNNRINVF